MGKIHSLISILFYVLTASALALTKRAPTPGQLSQVTDFGSNPTNVGFYIYVPNNLSANPAIIVAIHYCTGTAQAYYSGSPYATYAETHNIIVIYPESPYDGKCWDVSSESSLTHNGGGNSNSIANMVEWTLAEYGADSTRVFVTGTSSGAMMTNVMAATYPSLFAAGIAYAGVPAGCFYSDSNQQNGWNSTCSQGQSISTPEHWADIARAMNPGYEGSRPKMQIYHGSEDATLFPQNYYETTKQWAGVFGYEYENPESVENDTPVANWDRTTWGDNLQGILANGVGHNVQLQGEEDLKWFGFTS